MVCRHRLLPTVLIRRQAPGNVSGHIGYISPVSEFTPKSVQTTDLRTDLVYMIRVYADNPDKFLRQGMPRLFDRFEGYPG